MKIHYIRRKRVRQNWLCIDLSQSNKRHRVILRVAVSVSILTQSKAESIIQGIWGSMCGRERRAS